jgi:putative FmdB family regulatory protein
MPIYEYRCPNGHTFEVFQRMSDPPAERCEVCQAAPVEKILFPVAVHFKGSGFYATDYGRGKRKDGTKEAGTGESGAATTESAPKKDSGSDDKKAKPAASD